MSTKPKKKSFSDGSCKDIMDIWLDKGRGNPDRNVDVQTTWCWRTCGFAWWQKKKSVLSLDKQRGNETRQQLGYLCWCDVIGARHRPEFEAAEWFWVRPHVFSVRHLVSKKYKSYSGWSWTFQINRMTLNDCKGHLFGIWYLLLYSYDGNNLPIREDDQLHHSQ